ncbi:PaaI family thioesterase [Flagellatimonas centrodinii]|uniref:PaaI family thioesterase n=1 Tax=Flagellatimonas centrodinii TaxID=2806210 RepID=UPI001FEDC09E|nr:PaaI family thioesterase [Flagellatimonas centrodinii]ULQ46378.1 PaaI family thioesterase [Flagellatimonas centrodinii]
MNTSLLLPPLRSIEALAPRIAELPYARFLGFSLTGDDSGLVGRMAYDDSRLGNVTIRALHGGTLGAMMELTATCELLLLPEILRVPKIINITVEYLRSAGPADVLARASITRHGRRLANVRVVAWQDDEARPVAAANTHFLLAV